MSIVSHVELGADAPLDVHAALLHDMVASKGSDMTACIQTFHRLLFALAARYPFPDPEEAVYLALSDIRHCCPGWTSSRLPAKVWVLAVAKRRFDQVARVNPSDERC
ncbi:hypothetical protein E7T09_08445 [Deinococcus sp. KSM4-11]|uniref:hypothetical protein n=1 Tax=Deinococcus sp. KSM4-11 TaxID=2568654 RepID=UPI0010A50D0B|nr:hypothetical protein [Deinococcus sp. KSM4-11]THF87176.1 hypothetical protein E7T09_08445 [Deinococcus sp. KSM4-11]